ncbi:MAG: tRNA lysidine(34) synthetase TilS [Pseudomonadota bacterium]
MTEAQLLDLLEAQLAQRHSHRVGVAVSGGSDSVALLCLMVRLAEWIDLEPVAISVDHRLRPEAAGEIKQVIDICGRLGVQHHIEFWSGWDGQGNLQAAAREARYDLIADWAHAHNVATVALGHTANDQAETTLMRLARGAGVDGLAAMAPHRVNRGITWARPLLGVTRQALRLYLQERGIPWIEDPSNENIVFERVRIRQALKLLEPLGVTVTGLARTAEHMRKARQALDWQTFLAARDTVSVRLGAIHIDMRRYRTLPDEIARRLLVKAIMWIASAPYPPRSASIATALEAMQGGTAATLEGVQIQRVGAAMWLFREHAAVAGLVGEVGDLWDDRWTLDGPEDDPEIQVRALGEDGVRQVPSWRETGLPRAAVLSLPGVWVEDELIAAPGLPGEEEWTCTLEGGPDSFLGSLLSH